MSNIIEISHLNKSFRNKVVLKDLTLHVKDGENLVILGKSGIGKSVLIKCIVGLIVPDSGTIRVFDKNISDLSLKELNKVRTRIGFLFQGNALYDSMSVRENLEFPLRKNLKMDNQQKMDMLVQKVLEDVGLPEAADVMPAELSGGMQKRIGLARTLILEPEIILYDEPTTGLDPITAGEINLLINRIQKHRKTSSIIITHDKESAKLTGDRIVILNEGNIFVEGTYEELVKKTDIPFIRSFFMNHTQKTIN